MEKQTRALPNLLIRNRNFMLLWGAYGVSAIGDHLSELALLKERGALEGDQATRVQALITFGFFLPFIFVGPIAGWWADRFSRKATMIGSDLLRAVVMSSLIVSVPLLARWGWGDYSIVAPLFVTGALAAFFSPCRQAMLPTLIREDQLVRANAMINALGTIGTILSAILGGIIVNRLGRNWNYQLDAATFLLSAVLVAGIALQKTRPAQVAQTGIWQPVIEGFRYVNRHRRILQLILLGTIFWASAGAVISMIPALVRDIFGGNIEEVGIYRGLLGVGLALGAVVLTILGSSITPQVAVLSGLAAGAFWVFMLDVAYVFKLGKLLPAISLIGIGGAGATLLVTIMTNIQRFVPNARRGRVFGVSDMATMAAMVLATGLLGVPHYPHLDDYVPWLLLLVAGLLFGGLVVAWRIYRRGVELGPVTWLTVILNRFWCAFWFRLRRVGICRIPTEGPCLVASNHTSGIDSLAMIASSPHRLISFLVAEEHYHTPVAHSFMRMNDCIPINRERPGKAFLERSIRHLREGKVLGIFPEGTYQESDGAPGEFKSGVGLLALRTGTPVVPCYIRGTTYTESPYRALFRRHNAEIRYGKPVDLREFEGRERDRAAQREATAKINAAIDALRQAAEAEDAAGMGETKAKEA